MWSFSSSINLPEPHMRNECNLWSFAHDICHIDFHSFIIQVSTTQLNECISLSDISYLAWVVQQYTIAERTVFSHVHTNYLCNCVCLKFGDADNLMVHVPPFLVIHNLLSRFDYCEISVKITSNIFNERAVTLYQSQCHWEICLSLKVPLCVIPLTRGKQIAPTLPMQTCTDFFNMRLPKGRNHFWKYSDVIIVWRGLYLTFTK